MEKFIGAAMILVSALGFGRCCVQSQRKHFKQLLQWKEYIWRIQSGIEGWNTTVIPLLEELGNQAQDPFSTFFIQLADALKDYTESDVLSQWRRLAEEKRKEFDWSPGEWETFLDGGKLFARSDKEMIGKEGAQLSKRLDYYIDQAQSDAGNQERISLTLSASVGIMLIILLI
ncbi:MAG: stage III sporulation protein AB [Lachnospiraceae bacterium]|nr:stage III sporulation protein AB [Lachnospiraceae bacterium]